ncbi:hypothetical protein NLO72_12010 [Pseudomonas tremae]|uniref:Uncharacterized protein n=2 Tax=Pseudomonas syringae group TaxID=136849 RepID=A0AAE6QIQ5_9PSED|nr:MULTISPECIES: hypothetical protein [Pseudomonas syringae group]MCF5714687.1 hypothetical protein [Pseudomonas tremae]MCF5743343.1 hypothetical protein [Pseudomonas tremae]MCF5803012.1 hypothetical protein [Pseudomonas tremae]MCF5811390.1 hypothetical protein [Pseudomonas tremae]MCQ2989951.1 hypothetical protein [Pseudomonas tremae]
MRILVGKIIVICGIRTLPHRKACQSPVAAHRVLDRSRHLPALRLKLALHMAAGQ